MTTTSTRDLVIVACAVSAGIHAALTPEHLGEGAAAGGGFLASAVVLAALAIWLTIRPRSERAPAAAILVLGGLLLAYGLAVTTGVPYLHPDVEPVDGLAVWTKLVELAGLLAAARLTRPFDAVRPVHSKTLKGALR
jgi:hypothetical protein